MRKNDLFITVPSLFKCPISLDVMKSPVSLCTGVTYDRSSIQKWLDDGNNTCPATMQVLPNKEIIPNRTLQRLIQIWSDSLSNSSNSISSTCDEERMIQLLELVKMRNPELLKKSVLEIDDLLKAESRNKQILLNADGLTVMAKVLANLDGEISVFEKLARILSLILTECSDREKIKMLVNPGLLSSILILLRKGSLESRIDSARILELISVDIESKLIIAEKEGLLYELYRLMSYESESKAIEAGLSTLISLSSPRRIRLQIVKLKSIPVLSRILFYSETRIIAEKSLKLLETASTCTEGRAAICEDPLCIQAIVQKMLKVSSEATEHAVTVLWSVCHLFRDRRAQEIVTKSNGLTKILLLMQSNCSQGVRQMASDLLKIFRVNSKSCLSCYDTKTTHIMPF